MGSEGAYYTCELYFYHHCMVQISGCMLYVCVHFLVSLASLYINRILQQGTDDSDNDNSDDDNMITMMITTVMTQVQ